MEPLVADIAELVSVYVSAKDLFRQFAARDAHFVQVGDTVSIKDSADEPLILHSRAGYVRGHLPCSTIEEWSKTGLIYQDNIVHNDAEGVFRLTALGYRLGR